MATTVYIEGDKEFTQAQRDKIALKLTQLATRIQNRRVLPAPDDIVPTSALAMSWYPDGIEAGATVHNISILIVKH